MAINEGINFKQTLKLKKGASVGTVAAQLKNIERHTEPILNAIAKSTSHFIKLYIDKRRKRVVDRSKRRLASAFKDGWVDYSSKGIVVGLGKRSELESEFPYWEVLNYGGLGVSQKKVPGWFGRKARPDPSMAGASAAGGNMDLFHYNPHEEGNFIMVPQKPIEGIHYLEAANIYTKTLWSKAWKSFQKGVEHRVSFPTMSTKGI